MRVVAPSPTSDDSSLQSVSLRRIINGAARERVLAPPPERRSAVCLTRPEVVQIGSETLCHACQGQARCERRNGVESSAQEAWPWHPVCVRIMKAANRHCCLELLRCCLSTPRPTTTTDSSLALAHPKLFHQAKQMKYSGSLEAVTDSGVDDEQDKLPRGHVLCVTTPKVHSQVLAPPQRQPIRLQ